VSIEYDGDQPKRIEAVVVSCQHSDEIETADLRDQVRQYIIDPTLPAHMIDDNTKIHINPTGRFVIGGPQGDCGLTGRKIIVDTYGGVGSHGGGAFSGKDPSKVDRSASYMARHVAKNIVASGLAARAEVQVAYAIGVVDPVSVMIDTFGTGEVPDDLITTAVREVFPLSPLGIIEYLDLLRPIYKQTAAFGHFGRDNPDFTWEKTHRTADLRTACGL
jgi:S-adenosylmethionine synthetase